jgi:hypothetical protein
VPRERSVRHRSAPRTRRAAGHTDGVCTAATDGGDESARLMRQNRADTKRQVIADQQWTTVQEEDQQNRQLLDLSNQILELTKVVHAYATSAATARRPGAEGAAPAEPAAAADGR